MLNKMALLLQSGTTLQFIKQKRACSVQPSDWTLTDAPPFRINLIFTEETSLRNGSGGQTPHSSSLIMACCASLDLTQVMALGHLVATHPIGLLQAEYLP